MPVAHHTLILSDVHLCTVVRGDGSSAWLQHRRRHAALGAAIAATIDQAVAVSRNARLEIVLNGDFFDFDTPRAADLERGSVPSQNTHSEPGAVATMGDILGDHTVVVDALARALRASARVVLVPGNHDAQLAFPGVRRVLEGRLGHAQRLSFKSWFHRTPYGFHVEHGHQYDASCSTQGIGPVLVNGRAWVDDTLGSTTAYYAPCLSAGANPYVFDPLDVAPRDLLEGLLACLRVVPNHLADFSGTAKRMIEAVRSVGDRPRPMVDTGTGAAVRAETGADVTAAQLARHAALMVPGVSLRTFLQTGSFLRFVPDLTSGLRQRMAQIAEIYGCPGVIVGHTHRAHLDRGADGRWYGNTGTWAPGADAPSTCVWVVADERGVRPELRQVDTSERGAWA